MLKHAGGETGDGGSKYEAAVQSCLRYNRSVGSGAGLVIHARSESRCERLMPLQEHCRSSELGTESRWMRHRCCKRRGGTREPHRWPVRDVVSPSTTASTRKVAVHRHLAHTIDDSSRFSGHDSGTQVM